MLELLVTITTSPSNQRPRFLTREGHFDDRCSFVSVLAILISSTLLSSSLICRYVTVLPTLVPCCHTRITKQVPITSH